MKTAHEKFCYEDLVLRVEGPADHLAWLREFLLPDFEVSTAAAVNHRVELTIDEGRYEALRARGPAGGKLAVFVMDSDVMWHARWSADDAETCVAFDEEAKVFYQRSGSHIELLAAADGFALRAPLLRMLRELATRASLARGALCLHAACFRRGEHAALVVGPKRAGKTSLLIDAVAHPQVEYVSNDRALVACDTSGPAHVRGMPTILSLRGDTLARIPQIHARIFAKRYHYAASLNEAAAGRGPAPTALPDGRLGLSPRQFAALFDVPLAGSGVAQVLLFPEVTQQAGTVHLEPLDAAAAARRIEENLFARDHADAAPSFFADSAPRDRGVSLTARCVELAGRVRSYVAKLGLQMRDGDPSLWVDKVLPGDNRALSAPRVSR